MLTRSVKNFIRRVYFCLLGQNFERKKDFRVYQRNQKYSVHEFCFTLRVNKTLAYKLPLKSIRITKNVNICTQNQYMIKY